MGFSNFPSLGRDRSAGNRKLRWYANACRVPPTSKATSRTAVMIETGLNSVRFLPSVILVLESFKVSNLCSFTPAHALIKLKDPFTEVLDKSTICNSRHLINCRNSPVTAVEARSSFTNLWLLPKWSMQPCTCEKLKESSFTLLVVHVRVRSTAKFSTSPETCV